MIYKGSFITLIDIVFVVSKDVILIDWSCVYVSKSLTEVRYEKTKRYIKKEVIHSADTHYSYSLKV